MNWDLWAGEESALLDVLAGEHGEVGYGEFEVSEDGFPVGNNSGLGDNVNGGGHRRARHLFRWVGFFGLSLSLKVFCLFPKSVDLILFINNNFKF